MYIINVDNFVASNTKHFVLRADTLRQTVGGRIMFRARYNSPYVNFGGRASRP